MSNDLEKLAAEMRKMKPSKTSRKGGMDAAMAAFSAEFAADREAVNSAETITAEHNNLQTSQGLGGAARPTGQTIGTKPMDTFRSDVMSKIKSVFAFDLKTKMMMGSCAAALMFAAVIVPGARPGLFETPPMDAASGPVEAIEPLEIETPQVQTPAPASKTVEQTPDVNTDSTAARVHAELDKVKAKQRQDAQSIPQASLPAPAPKEAAEQAIQAAPISPPESNFRESLKKALEKKKRSENIPETNSVEDIGKSTDQNIAEALQRITGVSIERSEGEGSTVTVRGMNADLNNVTLSGVTLTNSGGAIRVSDHASVKTQFGDYILEEVPAEYKTETKTIITKEATTEIVDIPPVYETIMEVETTQEASTELVTIPPSYNPDGSIKTPARTEERIIPNLSKMVSRRVLKTPASTVERIVPAGTEIEAVVKTVIAPERFYLRDETGRIIREFESRDAFEKYTANPVISVAEKPVSTFSVDVDTASYSFFRSSVNRGQLPPASSVRVEEMINYFSYDYDAPRSADEPFKANVTVTPTPWNAETKLMRIGIKGYVPPISERPDSNIVFLIDTSGSMRQPNKLPLLINSFKLLLNTLDEDDTVSIVTYAGSAGTVLEPTAASDKNKIIAALNNLRAGGSTAGAAGLELAYNKAMESFDKDGVNRVILATDGDFNVGFRSPDEMKTFIEEKRKTGIFLSVLGFGNGNYKDDLMQSLAQNGNGTAAYIDTLSEANKVLANEAGSALITIAKDVKIQVEFNPDTIAEYRLIGYETRALKRQDFNNDAVDAGEIGAGHSVTALYELTPVGSPARVIDDLRYVSDEAKPKGNGSSELAFVKIRHKLPSSDTSTLQTFPVGPRAERNLKRASDDMRFAAAVAAVGQKLRGDTQLNGFSYSDAIELAVSGKGEDKHGYRSEFIQLLRLVETMEK